MLQAENLGLLQQHLTFVNGGSYFIWIIYGFILPNFFLRCFLCFVTAFKREHEFYNLTECWKHEWCHKHKRAILPLQLIMKSKVLLQQQ